MTEVWLPVHGFEGQYDISNYGRCRGVDREVSRSWGNVPWGELVLQGRFHTTGYIRYSLSQNGSVIDKYAHRLVAQSFLPNPKNLPYVNHKNGRKWDNHVDNLEWVSAKDNSKHAIDMGLVQVPRYIVYKDGLVVYDGLLMRELVAMGYQQPAISRCLSGKLNKHKGCTFSIKEIQ